MFSFTSRLRVENSRSRSWSRSRPKTVWLRNPAMEDLVDYSTRSHDEHVNFLTNFWPIPDYLRFYVKVAECMSTIIKLLNAPCMLRELFLNLVKTSSKFLAVQFIPLTLFKISSWIGKFKDLILRNIYIQYEVIGIQPHDNIYLKKLSESFL